VFRHTARACAWYRLGAALLDSHNAEDAVAPLQRAVALDPGDANAWFTLGLAWKAKGKCTAQASAAWEQGRTLDPALGDAWDRLGLTRFEYGNTGGATRWIEQLISCDSRPLRAATWHAIGLVRDRQGRRAAAIEAWAQAVAIDPAHAASMHELRLARGTMV
jgi:superkiller protein 3